ncbi:MAG: putative hydro-lyase [Ruminococcaceae bacterium]|nr:putative hydro-lyase [Oscillospiraceae bacterium]
MKDYANMSPAEVRALIRAGEITTPTAGMSLGYAQANLVILPKDLAYDFLLFAQRNPKPCPILEVSDVGSRYLKKIAPGADIARDIPRYRIYEDGVMTGEYTDVSEFWRDDFVSFLIGCSFSFESELLNAGVPVRHIEEGCNVPMYITNIPCEPAGVFSGNTVVSMRPIPYAQVTTAVTATAAMPRVHGAPIHIGDPDYIGINDISKPDFGDPVTIKPGETPVFWCCGVTPQAVLMASKPKFAITHAPGHMLITDVLNVDLKNQ